MSIIDVSHHNGKINWDKLKLEGVEAAFIKCTNGSHNTDNMYIHNASESRRVGILVGAYHFMLSQQNPDEQAENYLANKGMIDLLPVLDVEWDFKNNIDTWKTVSLSARIAMVGRFIQKIEAATGRLPIIYTNRFWWASMFAANREYKDIVFNECPLWLADYSTLDDSKLKCPPWSSFVLRQYSEKGKVDGIKTFVDLNRLGEGIQLSHLKI